MIAGQSGKRGRRGFRQAASFAGATIKGAGESRGFAVTRLLTGWPEIAGRAIAEHAQPVKVTFGRDGLGATLVVLTDGAHAPLVQMQSESLKDRVNACYGYRAISRIRVTQTAPTGFAEEESAFSQKSTRPQEDIAPEVRRRASAEASAIGDGDLRRALETLGANILSRQESKSRTDT